MTSITMTVCMAEALQSGTHASCASRDTPSSSFSTSPHPLSSTFKCCNTPHAKLLLPLSASAAALLLATGASETAAVAASPLAAAPGSKDAVAGTPAKSAWVMSSAADLIKGRDNLADLQAHPHNKSNRHKQ